MHFLLIIAFLLGLIIVAGTLFSAIQSFILPRSAPDKLTSLVFAITRFIFSIILVRAKDYKQRDRVMAFYAPISLLLLVPVWYSLISIGYMFMFRASGIDSWYDAFRLSGSSLLTLGFSIPDTPGKTILSFSEATLGLLLVALLIA